MQADEQGFVNMFGFLGRFVRSVQFLFGQFDLFVGVLRMCKQLKVCCEVLCSHSAFVKTGLIIHLGQASTGGHMSALTLDADVLL